MKNSLKIIPLLFLSTLISCSNSDSKNTLSTLNAYNIVEKQSILIDDCLSQSEDHYVVYFYSDTCSSCLSIKDKVVSFANLGVVKTYFLDAQKQEKNIQVCSAEEIRVWVDDVKDLYIVGTPTIIEVKTGITISNVAGEDDCLNLLESLSKKATNQSF